MSRASQIARFLLIIHGLFNIVQGIYTVRDPHAWVARAGSTFSGTPPQTVQAIGLGALGVGWYQFVFACQDNQALLAVTVPLRIVYAVVTATWGRSERAVVYELVIWALATLAAYPEILPGGKRRQDASWGRR